MFNNTFKYSVLAAALSALLAACGGSNNYNSEAPFQPKTVSGTAVDFYLANATVQFNDCEDANGQPVFVKTENDGSFSFSTQETCQSSALTITGGTDTVTGLPFTGTLKLKAADLHSLNGSLNVTPLTTLQSYLDSSQSSNIKPILEKIGLSAGAINTLESRGFDLSKFDPAAEGSSQDMAILFMVQQLANQIEDGLQAADLTPEQSTAIAFESIAEQVQSAPLFTAGNVAINPAALQGIVDASVSKAALLPDSNTASVDKTKINNNISAISNALATVASDPNASAASLPAAIASNPTVLSTIKDSVKAPVYSGFSLAGKSIAELKNSSSAAPLPINRAGISNALTVDFKLDNTSTALKDTVKLAFNLAVQRGAAQQTLDVSISNIALNYSSSGAITSAVIPAGTKISIASTVSSVSQSSITLTSDVNIAANGGAISLQNLIDTNDFIKTNYKLYADKLAANDSVRVTAFVLPMTYVVDASLGLATAASNIGGDSFIGSTLTAYFKLN